MANEEQVALLMQGTEVWNAWRRKNPHIEIDLISANLSDSDFREANLSCANLSDADLSDADLREANLNNANLSDANLSSVNLSDARLNCANLKSAVLRFANLSCAQLSWADLKSVDLEGARVLGANFTQATLTGSCIADWQIGSSTIFNDVKCDYVFRTYDYGKEQFSGRLPVDPASTFALGEFNLRFQIIASALETIDITFTEGIDWQAFFRSFQALRDGRPSAEIAIKGMESKGNAFVIRLEVAAEADKASIETEIKQLYARQLPALDAQYQERLRLQSEEIATYRQAKASLLHIVQTMGLQTEANQASKASIEIELKQLFADQLAALETQFKELLHLQSEEIAHHRQTQASYLQIMQTMAEKNSIFQTFHSSVGNVAGTNQGQMTAYINQNNEVISQLITALRASAQTFPPEQKDDVLMELDDLEGDLSKPEKQEPKRIGKRLQRLIAAGTAAATLAGGAATFSGNVNDFTANVLELGEKIGLSRDAIQSNP